MPQHPPRPSYRARRLALLLGICVVGALALELFVGDGATRARGGAGLDTIEIDSGAVGESVPVAVVTPDEGGDSLLVILHGRGGDEESNLSQAMYDGLDDLGDRAPVVAFPDGGGDSYWHDRKDGDWGTFVTEEVIPQVAGDYGIDPERVAIGGISMGGFGALDIARLNPGRFCAVGGHSPALWESGADSAAGAFDDASDFERHDVIAAARANPGFAGAPVWIDGGADDPFQPGIRAFVDAVGESEGTRLEASIGEPGGHEDGYWNAHWDEYMRFYAAELENCR